MHSTIASRPFVTTPDPAPPVIEAPDSLVARYVELVQEKRRIEDQMAFLRAELELIATASLSEAIPRGRFLGSGGGELHARLYPTCSFDRAEVGHVLQRAGRLTDVASIPGPSLARFLAKEPQMAARLGNLVRRRHGVMLIAGTS